MKLGAMRSKSGGDKIAREDDASAAEKQRVVQVRQQRRQHHAVAPIRCRATRHNAPCSACRAMRQC
jgi:hypothetical protein